MTFSDLTSHSTEGLEGQPADMERAMGKAARFHMKGSTLSSCFRIREGWVLLMPSLQTVSSAPIVSSSVQCQEVPVRENNKEAGHHIHNRPQQIIAY